MGRLFETISPDHQLQFYLASSGLDRCFAYTELNPLCIRRYRSLGDSNNHVTGYPISKRDWRRPLQLHVPARTGVGSKIRNSDYRVLFAALESDIRTRQSSELIITTFLRLTNRLLRNYFKSVFLSRRYKMQHGLLNNKTFSFDRDKPPESQHEAM